MGGTIAARAALLLLVAAAIAPRLRAEGAPRSPVPRTVKLRLYWLSKPPAAAGPLVRELPLEDYVAAVLAGESGGMRSAEALKAMAVVARTYAARNMGRHKKEGFDFCDTTHCQDARWNAVNALVREAARRTAGELLWFGPAPAEVFYHRHCGGMTESAAAVWTDLRAPYLRSQPDSFCLAHGKAAWQSVLSREEAERVLGGWPLRVVERSASGRVARIAVGGKLLSGTAFQTIAGRQLGWERVRSTWFSLRGSGDRVVIDGQGDGHGVGLCQTGAVERARAGHPYQRILQFYFPGLALRAARWDIRWRRFGGERVDVEVADGDPRQVLPDGMLRDLVSSADGALREAERRAGFRLDGRVRVRAYPSLEAYREATGEPGWVAASSLGRTIRLQPISLLIARGQYQAVLLHEMLHAVVQSRSAVPLPDWFAEGLVLYLESPGGAPRGEPVNEHIRRAPNESAMRAAYAAARGKVAGLVRRYGRETVLGWLDTGLPQEAGGPGGQR